jgi:hypothetical protein
LPAPTVERPATWGLAILAAVAFVGHMLVAGLPVVAGPLQQLALPGRLPPVISGHNNYYLWGPERRSGRGLITVGYGPSEVRGVHALYTHIRRAAVDRCRY